MTTQVHKVKLEKLFYKEQLKCHYDNYVTLVTIFRKDPKQAEKYFLNCMLIKELEQFIKTLIGNWVIFRI